MGTPNKSEENYMVENINDVEMLLKAPDGSGRTILISRLGDSVALLPIQKFEVNDLVKVSLDSYKGKSDHQIHKGYSKVSE
jgi:hypothetical protein